MKKTRIYNIKHILLVVILILSALVIINSEVKRMFPLKFQEHVVKYSKQNNIDPFFVYAVIKAESSFNPDAISNKDARGLMQITETTGKWGAIELNLEEYTVEKLFHPETNIKIGCWYLDRLMQEFNNDIDLVIAAYNGGSGNVTRWLQEEKYSKSGKTLDKIPFNETNTFLKRVKAYHFIYKHIYR